MIKFLNAKIAYMTMRRSWRSVDLISQLCRSCSILHLPKKRLLEISCSFWTMNHCIELIPIALLEYFRVLCFHLSSYPTFSGIMPGSLKHVRNMNTTFIIKRIDVTIAVPGFDVFLTHWNCRKYYYQDCHYCGCQ